jgi:hypothetical protein
MARKKAKTATRRSGSRPGGARRGSAKPAETAHAKRVRLYLEKHPGATKAEARGHKPAEHATRKERARQAGRLTENERAAIKRYAARQAKRAGRDPDAAYRAMLAWASRDGGRGFRDFNRLRAERDRLAKRGPTDVRMKRLKDGSVEMVGDTAGRDRNVDAMQGFAEDYELPDDAAWWLWYH